MVEKRKRAGIRALLAGLVAGLVLGGCGAPPATLELIAVAQKALADASVAEKERQAETRQRIGEVQAALDSAFDADVRLVEAGKVVGAASQPVRLSAEWVISARKGYAAGRDALTEEARRAEAAGAVRLDNLAAGSEALDMANHLIVLQYSLSQRTREVLLTLQRRLFNGQ